MKIDLKELQEFYEKATPGEWLPCIGSGANLCTAIYAYNDKGEMVLISDFLPDWFFARKGHTIPDDHVPDMKFVMENHNAFPALVGWIEKAIPVLQAIEPLARVYCSLVCHDKNCEYCDYIKKDIPDAVALLREVEEAAK